MFSSRRLVVFVGVVLAGAMLEAFAGPGGIARFLGISPLAYFSIIFIAAAVAAGLAPPPPPPRDWDDEDEERNDWSGSASEFLCDTCRYNDVRDCHRPERPNATSCEDYLRR